MNFSWYKPFIDAGIEVWPVFDGHSNCCKSGGAMPGGESCNILAGKRALAQELLDLALTYNLTGWQQDWEFTDAWVTVALVVKAHINRVVISFDVVCLTIARACSSLRCRWNWAGYNETMSFVEETFRVRAARSIHDLNKCAHHKAPVTIARSPGGSNWAIASTATRRASRPGPTSRSARLSFCCTPLSL